jgi:hypothetical protein
MTIAPAPYTTSAHLTADEILFAAAGCSIIQLRSISLVVVTGTHTPDKVEPQTWPFTPGELLVVNLGVIDLELEGDAIPELFGTRDVSQWDTRTLHYFTTDMRRAMALAELVRGGAERGMWQWAGDHWFRSPDQAVSMEQLNSAGGDPDAAFVGDTDGENTWGRDILWPAAFTWPTPPSA